MAQEMMRAAVLSGPRRIELKDVPVPPVTPGTLKIGERSENCRPALKPRTMPVPVRRPTALSAPAGRAVSRLNALLSRWYAATLHVA